MSRSDVSAVTRCDLRRPAGVLEQLRITSQYQVERGFGIGGEAPDETREWPGAGARQNRHRA